MLAATLFTTLFKQHLECSFDSSVLSYQSDNLELIKRQPNPQSYTYNFPNTTLTAKFNLTKMIHMLHRDHELPSSFCHVKGHQDRDKAHKDLNLSTQLNVEGDRLATAYYDHPEAQFDDRIVPLPSCLAQLSIAGVDVTSKYKTLLVRALTERRYLEHIQHRFFWDDTMVDTIEWRALSIALRRIQRPCTCTNICNDLLPTVRILYQWNQHGHDSCSLCEKEESTEHMIFVNTHIVCNYGGDTSPLSKLGSTGSTPRLASLTLFAARSLIGLTMVLSTLVSTMNNIIKPYNIYQISAGAMSIWVTLLPNGQWYRFPPDRRWKLLKLAICGYLQLRRCPCIG